MEVQCPKEHLAHVRRRQLVEAHVEIEIVETLEEEKLAETYRFQQRMLTLRQGDRQVFHYFTVQGKMRKSLGYRSRRQGRCTV